MHPWHTISAQRTIFPHQLIALVSPQHVFFAKQHNEAEADRERNPSMRAEPNVVFCVVIYFSKASIRMWWPVHVMIFPSDIVVCKWSTTNIACATQRYKTHWPLFKLSPIFQKIVFRITTMLAWYLYEWNSTFVLLWFHIITTFNSQCIGYFSR